MYGERGGSYGVLVEKPGGKRENLEDLDLHGRIVLKRIFKK
jgi:hypothetical protein